MTLRTHDRLAPFGTTIFTEMTRLANEHGAVNLAQGFPDFDGPEWLLQAAREAISSGRNQYARSRGLPALTEAIARSYARLHALSFDPATEVVVTSGATEAMAAALLGTVGPGDEVIFVEPFYDAYPAALAMAGGVPRYCTLRAPDFALDADAIERLVTRRTKWLVLNTPHNPTGRVFTAEELDAVAAVVERHGLHVLSDEVYEHLTWDGARHVPFASRPGMRERTLTLSSAGKSFSVTGWKVGWAVGPAALVDAVQAAHQFLTFSVVTPLQAAVAVALDALVPGEGYLAQLRRDYEGRRAKLLTLLREAGFDPLVPEGAYFVLAGFSRHSNEDDASFARTLTTRHGVAAIPPTAFYSADPSDGRRLLRFAFCKRDETLAAAAARLAKLAS